MPIGLLIDKYSIAKSSIFYGFFGTAILEICSPMAAHMSFRLSFAFRLIMGLLQVRYLLIFIFTGIEHCFKGGFYPAVHKLFSKWVPASEMGRFTFTCLGSSAGSVITWMCTGYLIELLGWKYSFYVPGTLVAIYTLAWYFLVFETPARHPRITATERVYIESNLTSAGIVVKNNVGS